MAPNPYQNLEVSIKRILPQVVTINEEEEKKMNKHLQQVFDILETEMKEDPTFDALFGQRQYVGSYYEKMKIEMPDEFDINYELSVEPYIGELEVCSSEQLGFCQLKLHENTSPVFDTGKALAKKQVKKWTDAEGFLLRAEVNKWMQSIVNKAVDKYEKKNEERMYELKTSCHGPAVTVTVTFTDEIECCFSLDFVPVFLFRNWPNIENLRDWTPEMEEKRWYAVPKPTDCDRDFRLSFTHQEKPLLHDTHHMKPVLKLIKKLRNIQQWKGLSSYYIKTVFLWKTAANGKDYWTIPYADIFMEMLKEMKHCFLESKSIPFFWIKENDLLSKLNPHEKDNIGGYIKNMIEKIENNLDVPGFLERYFNLPDRTANQNGELHTSHQESITAVYQGLPLYEEQSGDENSSDEGSSYDMPIVNRPRQIPQFVTNSYSRPRSRTVNPNPALRTRQQEDNTGTAIAVAVGVGAAALLTAGVLAHFFGNRRARD